jgi:hypothetical protein
MLGTKRETGLFAPDEHRSEVRKQFSYATPQLRRQAYYKGNYILDSRNHLG